MREPRRFRFSVLFGLLVGLVVVASTPLVSCSQADLQGPVAGRSLRFTTIDYPGSTETILFRINVSGQIVGAYFDGPNVVNGFLLQGGSFSTIDVPGAVGGNTRISTE
jgi:hypothetical protein